MRGKGEGKSGGKGKGKGGIDYSLVFRITHQLSTPV